MERCHGEPLTEDFVIVPEEARLCPKCGEAVRLVWTVYAEEVPRPETELCSKCGMGTGWDWQEGEGWVSSCCTRPPKALPADA